MKLKIKKTILAFAMILTAGITFFTTKSNATDVITADDVLSEAYAGVTVVIELDTTPSEEEVQAKIEEANAWKNPGSLIMANASDAVNIREAATTDSEIIGRLYSNCGGYIIEYTDTWTKISSGNAEGWVCNDYIYFGEEALNQAEAVGCNVAIVNATELRVRTDTNTDSEVLGIVSTGDEFDIVAVENGWVLVDYEGQDGYISEEYVVTEFRIKFAETLEEIEAREAAERQAALEAERYQYYGVYAANATDVELLAAIIECEAGYESYEGRVAVGAVIMNRVRSAAFPNTIYGVVYAPGQFTPAGAGLVDRKLATGVCDTCLQAAQEVIDGYSNVGGATFFRRVGYHEGIVIGNHVFW